MNCGKFTEIFSSQEISGAIRIIFNWKGPHFTCVRVRACVVCVHARALALGAQISTREVSRTHVLEYLL